MGRVTTVSKECRFERVFIQGYGRGLNAYIAIAYRRYLVAGDARLQAYRSRRLSWLKSEPTLHTLPYELERTAAQVISRVVGWGGQREGIHTKWLEQNTIRRRHQNKSRAEHKARHGQSTRGRGAAEVQSQSCCIHIISGCLTCFLQVSR